VRQRRSGQRRRQQRGVQVGLINVADEIDGCRLAWSASPARTAARPSACSRSSSMVRTPDAGLDLGQCRQLGLQARHAPSVRGLECRHHARHRGGWAPLLREHFRTRRARHSARSALLPRHRRHRYQLRNLQPGRQAHRNLASLRLQAGYAVARHLAVVVGPTLHVQTAWDNDDRQPRGVSFAEQFGRAAGRRSASTPVSSRAGVLASFLANGTSLAAWQRREPPAEPRRPPPRSPHAACPRRDSRDRWHHQLEIRVGMNDDLHNLRHLDAQPSSSRISRTSAAAGVSPGSTLPPGIPRSGKRLVRAPL